MTQREVSLNDLNTPSNTGGLTLEEFNERAGRALLMRGLQPEDIFTMHDIQQCVEAEEAWLERSQAIVEFDQRIMKFGISRKDFPDSWLASNASDAMSRDDLAERTRMIREHKKLTLTDPHLPDRCKD